LLAANIASTYGSSSLLHAQIVLHKYKSSMLSTLQDYHKGLNGKQQWPFIATVGGSAPVHIAGCKRLQRVNESFSAFYICKTRGKHSTVGVFTKQ
jgi:hypothetical protein